MQLHSLSFLFLWQDLAINRIQIRNKIVSTQLKTIAKVQIIVASNVLHQFEVEVIPRSKKPSCLCVATYSNSQCTLFCTCLRLRSPPLHTLPDRTRHTCGIHFVPRQHRSNRGCVIFFEKKTVCLICGVFSFVSVSSCFMVEVLS